MPHIEDMAKTIYRTLPAPIRNRLRSSMTVVRLRNWIAERRYKGARHDEIFDEHYFSFVDRTTVSSAQVIADSIISAFAPTLAWDVGCGTGALLECLWLKGVTGRGPELAEAALRFCHSRNLDVKPFNILKDDPLHPEVADVVISMEVVAQLPATGVERYVDLLCSLGPVIVFSAEAPGGGDRLALNEQPKEYWFEKFAGRGYGLNPETTDSFRRVWEAGNVAPWFCRNVLLFERADA